MFGKVQIDYEIAKGIGKELGVGRDDVAKITHAFLDKVRQAIVETGHCELMGVGKLSLRFEKTSAHSIGLPVVEGSVRCRIYFSKAQELQQAVQERYGLRAPMEIVMEKQREQAQGMTKYAVDEGVDSAALEKAAAHGCPGCGSPINRHGVVVSCPNCGTEPFEKKK